ncbi:hypothetical protein OOT00_12730 [Desulfobotulus sp. H1]|uniref:Adenylyltransferase SoFic-like C-terminal domain-containing protein n=1 Tax=Desulfobotulus pelophilus TaxID=2823377 RepID=A0ABT3NBK8_9BACT|nr:hypothetical protein [Desulfobotulus pelophilus]MCW7754849.1 hypothetical protein [Desulfobotulus pelophilus]
MERDIARRQTASVYLKKPVEIGVLGEEACGKEKVFIHTKLMRRMSQDSNTHPGWHHELLHVHGGSLQFRKIGRRDSVLAGGHP